MADAVTMTTFGNLAYLGGASFTYDVAQFSPDGRHFVVIVKKGNIDTNTNNYSLLLFRTGEALESHQPALIASRSSSSNRPAIQDVKWLDNQSVAFLGETNGGVQEVYEVNCSTKRLTKLTHYPTSVVSYAIAADGSRMYFAAERPARGLLSEKTKRDGIVVSTQPLSDLIAGEERFWSSRYGIDLFMRRRGGDNDVPVRTKGALVSWSPLLLAPNGDHLVVQTMATDVPLNWRGYVDQWMKMDSSENHPKDTPRLVYQYELIDSRSGRSQLLLNAPIGQGVSGAAWAPDSRSVVVAGTFLPLDVPDSDVRRVRQRKRFVAEITVPGQQVVAITDQQMRLRRWDTRTGNLVLETSETFSTVDLRGKVVAYKRNGSGWKAVRATVADLSESNKLEVTLEEDMNTPPRIFVRDLATGQKSLLMDLNPRFGHLQFGAVENIVFNATDGHPVKAGLYRPPDYVAGFRYPLIIQTHGWNPERFWIDGPYSTAFAAQPLAGRGFVVIQLEENNSLLCTPEEARNEMTAYEGAIDYLDHLALIDRTKVGIIGFSRTGFGVRYALTHSKYQFAAATLADASDEGYLQYLTILNTFPHGAACTESVNGGEPFGDGLVPWLKNSPGFGLARVTTPVRLEANGPGSLLGTWEWFAGLSRLRKPVDFIYLPQATHVLVKPWERMTSQQGNVDWFSFWLQGEEDRDPAKAEQYARWRELRRLQQQQRPADTSATRQ